VKSNELKGLSIQELEERLEDTIKSLYHLRMKATYKDLKNVADIRNQRRNIARIKHVIAEKQRAQSSAATA
jgi:large subunit ribosomal protein L29